MQKHTPTRGVEPAPVLRTGAKRDGKLCATGKPTADYHIYMKKKWNLQEDLSLALLT
jgi:hypothetical protein